ncbi:hypothetical protein GKE82_06730 [Conexibacter sp. W3-3-2]|uniref:hypothetical protein n=1 Tax=Conexibacter sp. W3-3-2 TaxID=2675227 RepID=UPI0012B7B215|nr:hypothetical protein [Conexibacter sp. W3-3-2]MTD44004.1 hypothetical protein [Conexibacter sp. W3-3-2]
MSAPDVSRVVLLAGAADPTAVGAALATGLRSARGDGVAVVAVTPGSACGTGAPTTVPARAAARRLAASLRLRGTHATASGRLVHVRLADEPLAATAEAVRVAATCDGPMVVVVAGPREPAHDPLVAAADVVVAAVPGTVPDGLAAVARADGIAHVVALDPSVLARGLALTGLPVLAPLRALGRTLVEEAA